MFVYNILIMETPNINNKRKVVFIPNPDLDNNWIKRFTDTWKELNSPLWFSSNDPNLESKFTPLYRPFNIEQFNWLNNKKHILVITLPNNFISILKILKTNKEQYFTLYMSKWSLKEKTFDAIVVDSSIPYYLEFYNSIKKYIKYKVPTYLLEKETLKTLK